MKNRCCWEISEEAVGVAVLQLDDLLVLERARYWRAGLVVNAILLETDMIPWYQLVVWV